MGSKHPLRGNQCVAQSKRTMERCKQLAIPGGRVCRYHGGNTPALREAANRKLKEYEVLSKMHNLGERLEIPADEALIQQVHEAAGNVAYLRKRVQALEEGISDNYEAEVLVRLYGEERDRLVRFSKAALDSGIEERKVQLAEQYGELVATAFMAVVNDARLKLTTNQMRLLRHLMAEKMRLLDALADEAHQLTLPRPKGAC